MDFEEIRERFMNGNYFIRVNSYEEACDALEFLKAATGKTTGAFRPTMWLQYPNLCYSRSVQVISACAVSRHNLTVEWCQLCTGGWEAKIEEIYELL